MTILITPLLKCNLNCGYCFAEAYREFEPVEYNLPAIFAHLERLCRGSTTEDVCLHGGECTLIKRQDFEAICKRVCELRGRMSLQTNCYRVDDDLIRIYKQYRVSVGVSIDGDGELNRLRGFSDPAKNAEYTKQVVRNIIKIHKAGVHVGVIVVLSKANADSAKKLRKLAHFILFLRGKGINSGRLNLMWSNHEKSKPYELTPEQAANAWLYLYKHLKPYTDLQWQPFRDFTDNLLGYGHSSCSYGKCEYTQTLTRVIQADGSLGNCDRTHQELNLTRRTDQPTQSRYTYLINTWLKGDGCLGCRFYECCYGGCPAEGVGGDYMKKSRFCKAIYVLYEQIERDIKEVMPNIFLITDWHGTQDYFDAFKKNEVFDAFERLSFVSAVNPSTWKNVQLRRSNPQGSR